MENFMFYMTNFVLFFGLYFSFLWILIMMNSRLEREEKVKRYPSISLLIPAFNEEVGIKRTIESCLKLNYEGKIEIIVINDCSKDNTMKVVERYADKIRIIDKKKNEGKAAAVNSGIKIAKGELIGVLDADSVISKNSVKNLIRYFERDDGKKVGAVISKMKPDNESGNLLERIQLIEYLIVGLIRALTSSIELLHTTPGVLSVYRRDVLKEVGGFDVKNITEDFEIGVRIRKKGYLIEYAHNSEVYTTTPRNFKIFLKQRIRWSRGFIQTHRKHRDLFFNRKHGMYGLYQFPLNVFGPIVYFLAIYLISFKIYKELYEFLFKLFYAPDTIVWFDFGSISKILLTLNLKIDFLIFFSLLCLSMMIYGIIKFYDYNFFRKNMLKKIWALIVYVMVYNYIYIYVWIVSIIKELKNKDYDWGTK